MERKKDAGELDNLDEVEQRLCTLLESKNRRWADLYALIARVEDNGLWRDRHHSFTKWMEHLARRSRCNIQYLWRVRKAGKFYARYAEIKEAQGEQASPIGDVALGDEMLADIDRLCESKPERIERYMDAAIAGNLSKAKVKQILRATSGTRRPGAKAKPKPEAVEDGGGGVEAGDILAALVPAAIYSGEQIGKSVPPGCRRIWHVFGEFPVQTGTSDKARRIDAMVATNIPNGYDQYRLQLIAIEVKVAEHDLINDTKHLEYERFADECYFAVPEELADLALDHAPDGWGVLSYSPGDGSMRTVRFAETRPGDMRMVSLETAGVKAFQKI